MGNARRYEATAFLHVLVLVLAVAEAAADGSLLGNAVLIQSFADASGSTPISAENDGTFIYTAQGGFAGANMARYLQDGTLDQVFQPGPDFRSLYADNGGQLFAKEYGAGAVYSITSGGVATLLYTLNDAESQSAASLNSDDSELYTMSSGQIRRYDATNGALLGSFALIGWGTTGSETAFPDDFQMETNGSGRILTYTQGVVSEWDLAGVRIGTCDVPIATPADFETTWSFGVGNDDYVYLYNAASGEWDAYDVGIAGSAFVPVCFGDGGGATCPCGNSGGASEGCANSTAAGGVLNATGSDSVGAGDAVLHAANALPNQPGLFFQGDLTLNGGNGIPFGDGLRCCGVSVVRLQTVVPDGAGDAATSIDIAAVGGASAGEVKCYQYWYRDPVSGPCGSGFNLTSAVEITWKP